MTKTLLFCTAFVPAPDIPGSYVPSAQHGTAYFPSHDGKDRFYSWEFRYRIWLDAVRSSNIHHDQILIVDDGSPVLPSWDDVTIVPEGQERSAPQDKTCFYHFKENLGRQGVSNFPGWVRSFLFAGRYARLHGFDRIIHLESDAFLISGRMQEYANTFEDGWTALWCPRHNRPESGIQFIAGSGLERFIAYSDRDYSEFADTEIEATLPFSHVERRFTGDRFGELQTSIPKGADWCMQARPDDRLSLRSYYWWITGVPWLMDNNVQIANRVDPRVVDVSTRGMRHEGISYLDALQTTETLLRPANYLEIGTNAGHSLERISCDAVCVDPNFVIHHNVLGKRRATHFFQGTSDDFFADPGTSKLFPTGIDLAFLDGLHIFEALLRDFMNVEHFANEKTVVIMHDCLPLNTRMAERQRYNGGDDEVPETRDWWTGDVWKVLPILKKYRPDISVSIMDCGPTGLVFCTGLKRGDSILHQAYREIVAEFGSMPLDLVALRAMFPTYDSRQVFSSSYTLRRALWR